MARELPEGGQMDTVDPHLHMAHPHSQHGTHIGLFYEDPSKYLAALAGFFQEGLERGERCAHVAGDITEEQIAAVLEARGINVQREVGRGALRFVSKWEYRQSEAVDPQTMACVVNDLIKDAQDSGFDGLRLSLDMTWTIAPELDSQNVARWESLWNDCFLDAPMMAICAYDRKGLPPDLVHAALLTHPTVLTERGLSYNLFYEPPTVFLSGQGNGVRVDWMMGHLGEFNALLAARTEQQTVIVDLGRHALAEHDLQSLFGFTIAAVSKTLAVESCEILELTPGNAEALLRAGAGWVDALNAGASSGGPSSLGGDGAVSGMSCIVRGPGEKPWGVLGVHTAQTRVFTQDDIRFLQAAANVLAGAVERSAIEQSLRDADRRKDEFLAMLSHELRNPLAPIRSSVQLLRLDRSGTSQQEALGALDRQVGMLTRLVDDLLDVSRVTTGRIQLVRANVEMNSLLQGAADAFGPQMASRGHEFSVSLAGSPLWVNGDATRLEQILVNLLSNAAKYSPEGSHVSMSIVKDGSEAVIRVKDSGMGIEPGLLPHIFTLFTQGERALDRAQSGLGIGLALVKNLVEMHGGTLTAASEGRGMGSEFVVRLPVVLPSPVPPLGHEEHSKSSTESKPAGREDRTGDALRVLMVDDNADAAGIMAKLLHRKGYEVRTANDGPVALQAVVDFRPAVVLLDIGLPEMDGYEVARRIRQDETLRGMVLVAMTGYSQAEDVRRAREAGFDHHLVKPADFAALQQILESAGEVSR